MSNNSYDSKVSNKYDNLNEYSPKHYKERESLFDKR
jgi:hypothetical protein